MRDAEIRTIDVGSQAVAVQAVANRTFSRPAILDATRMIGFSDAEVGRLLGCSPMQVNSWVKGRRPIPPVKHYALAIFLLSMIGMIGEAPDGHHKARAKLLEDAVITLVQLALDKALPKIPNHVIDAGMALADQMLARLEAH